MTLNEAFADVLCAAIKEGTDVLFLRECLLKFKIAGMDRSSMVLNLETLRKSSDPQTEDILLELMDFVTGYCSPERSVF